MSARRRWAWLALVVTTATGCPPETPQPRSWAYVQSLTIAPPGEQAALTVTYPDDATEEPTRTLVLSQGAALALSCTWDSQPCTVLTSSDPTVVTPYRGSGSFAGSTYASHFVVTGTAPGTARLDIVSATGTSTISATVVP